LDREETIFEDEKLMKSFKQKIKMKKKPVSAYIEVGEGKVYIPDLKGVKDGEVVFLGDADAVDPKTPVSKTAGTDDKDSSDEEDDDALPSVPKLSPMEECKKSYRLRRERLSARRRMSAMAITDDEREPPPLPLPLMILILIETGIVSSRP